MELALSRVHTDIMRTSALVDASSRVMTDEEAATITGYLRCLGGIVRERNKPGRGRHADKSWEELLEMAKGIPELRDALKVT
jgi:hypothetical protein